jgi:O-antigen/teichoic acid export membrane protein
MLQSRSARNIITLMTGTGLAQAIPIAVSPILTRLYTPEDFGIFALYVSLVSILTIFVTGRYELAISLPKDERDAFHIVALSIALTVILSSILLIIISVFNFQIAIFLGGAEIAIWLYWIPFSTLFSGVYTNLNYWNNRNEFYKEMAISRVTQTASSATTQLSMSFITAGPAGLLGGQFVGQILSIIYLLRQGCAKYKVQIKSLRWRRIRVQSHKYRDFPRIMIIAHGFNSASSQMPIILLGSLFNIATAGYYMMIQRVMGVPITLISSAFGDVFRQEASMAFISSRSCRSVYVKTFKSLFAIGVLPFTGFFFFAPELFQWFFGESWREAGEYAQILTPMFFLQFVTSPLSSVFMIVQKQRLDLAWQIGLFLFVIMSLLIGASSGSVLISLVLFSCSYCLMYSVNALLAYRLTKP